MVDVKIPGGFGIPLVNLETDLLPSKTVDALLELSGNQVEAESTARIAADGALGSEIATKADLVDGVVPDDQLPPIPSTAADVGAVPTSRTVAGKPLSSNITLAKGDVGLGNVDNTADADKPVSAAAQAVLDSKADLEGGRVPYGQLPDALGPEGLSATIATRVPIAIAGGRSAVLATVGDSISAAAGSSLTAFSRLGPALAGDHLRYWDVRAVGGATLTDINGYIDEVLAYTPTPTAIGYMGGTNDMNGTLAAAIAAHQIGIGKILAAGAVPILWAPPPRGSGNDTANATTAQFASYIRALGLQHGWEVLDAHQLLADPATGNLRSIYDDAPTPNTVDDGIHPNYAGHLILARAYAAIIRRVFPAVIRPQLANKWDSALTASMGLFLTDTNADGFADGTTSVSASGTAEVVTGAPVGNWQRKKIASGGTSGGSIRIETTGITPGNVYEFAYVARANLVMADSTTGAVTSFWRSESTQIAGVDPGGGVHGAAVRGLSPDDLVWIRFTATAPALTTRVRTDIAMTGTASADGYFDVGMFAIRDLTALGLTR